MITFLITFAACTAYTFFLSNHIKKHNYIHYAIAIILLIVHSVVDIVNPSIIIDNGVLRNTLYAFTSGTVGTCFLILVMYGGAVDRKSMFAKKLLRIRKELSIIGCYLLMHHSFYNILNYKRASTALFITGLVSVVIMIPLFVTSFIAVRKRMDAKVWSRLQKSAYLFYFLVYAHMMMANMSMYVINVNKVTIYTTIFLFYTYLRVGKEWSKMKKRKTIYMA